MNQKSEITSYYVSEMSSTSRKIPIDETELIASHKKAIDNIKSKFNMTEIPNEIKSSINGEYQKISQQNKEKFKDIMIDYLSDKFKDIDGNVKSGNYKDIDQYKKEIESFITNILKNAPHGPNRESILYEFILDQIMIHSEKLISSSMNEYEQLLSTNKDELSSMSNTIQGTKEEHAKLMKQIEEKGNQIKKLEAEKTEMLKQGLRDTDKLGKILKEKNAEITKLNETIELMEGKNTKYLNELKNKLDASNSGKDEKENKIKTLQTDFEKKKIELKNKIELLEKNIKNLNETKSSELKSKKESSFLMSKNSEIEKYESQIISLNKKISTMTEKSNDLEAQIELKEKALETERVKCDEMIAEYEKKIAEANLERESNEEEIKNLELAQDESEAKLKSEYEEKIAELKANISKNELVYKDTEEKLKEMIIKANNDLEILKQDNTKAQSRLEEIKSQISNDKVEYDKYIKILEENNKRLLSQYEESVKENNMLKTQQEGDILRINAETEKKIIFLTKDNERIQGEIDLKKKEMEDNEKELNEKIKLSEEQIPTFKSQENKLNEELEAFNSQKIQIDAEYKSECEQLEKDHLDQLEKIKIQCKEDIENNKINNEKDIKDIEAYCEQEKIELNDKLTEEIENNKKREEELVASYAEKIKILEEVKNEKIEELTEAITEAENNHQAYVDEVEEDIKQHAEQIEGLNDELNEATISLNTIQSTHEAVMKSNYDTFKTEKNNMEISLQEIYSKNKEFSINISIYNTKNAHLQEQISKLNEQLLKIKAEIQTVKEKYDNEIQKINGQIAEIDKEIISAKANYEQEIALKNQEIEYTNEQIKETKKELDEFQATFEERLAQCKAELTAEYSAKLTSIQNEKNELEITLKEKKKEYQDLELNYHSTTALLMKEKEVLTEKLNNVTNQTKELEENLIKEREENIAKINQMKKEFKERNEQISKENEAIQSKLRQNELDYNELANNYDKDTSLWKNKYAHLNEEKEKAFNDLNAFKEKYNSNVDDLQSKVISERERLEQIYRNAVNKREESFNKQLLDANKLFAAKYESVNSQNQQLTLENKKLIETLNQYESQGSLKEKETKLVLSKEASQRLKKEISNLTNTKDKQIEELMSTILKERRQFTSKVIELENKLREYESKRKSLAVDKVRQKAFGDKDKDEYVLLIDRLRTKIAELEKANIRLSTENRDSLKENETLKKRNTSNGHSSSSSYIPRNRMNSGNKENLRTQSNIPVDILNMNKKNLLLKFNQKEDDLQSFGAGSNRNSFIIKDDNE